MLLVTWVSGVRVLFTLHCSSSVSFRFVDITHVTWLFLPSIHPSIHRSHKSIVYTRRLEAQTPEVWSFLLGALIMFLGIVLPLGYMVFKNKKVFKTY